MAMGSHRSLLDQILMISILGLLTLVLLLGKWLNRLLTWSFQANQAAWLQDPLLTGIILQLILCKHSIWVHGKRKQVSAASGPFEARTTTDSLLFGFDCTTPAHGDAYSRQNATQQNSSHQPYPQWGWTQALPHSHHGYSHAIKSCKIQNNSSIEKAEKSFLWWFLEKVQRENTFSPQITIISCLN